jgi:hypothetical protein
LPNGEPACKLHGMAPLVLVCSLCLPLSAGSLSPGALRFDKAHPEEVGPPAPWQAPVLVGVMAGSAVGGDALAATRGFGAGRIAADQGAFILGAGIGIAAVTWLSFALEPRGGGLLLPLSERKLIATLLIGGLVGGVGGLAAAEAIGGHLNGWALFGGAAGFVISSSFVIALIDGIFGLPVWANLVALPLGLSGGAVGGYALAAPRSP